MRGVKLRSVEELPEWSVALATAIGGGSIKESIDSKMPVSGGTFTGTISVPDNATHPTAAVNLAQLEDLIASSGGGAAQITNKIINPNFIISQRWGIPGGVISGNWVAGYRYFDMWKAGPSGCTCSFDPATSILTISAGTLIQVIEGINLRDGQHTLSWTGTAQGRVDSGSYGASGLIGTAAGGVNQAIEFGVGTLSNVQYEEGTSATQFSPRQYGLELMLCQRYYQTGAVYYEAYVIAGLNYYHNVQFQTPMRGYPTIYFNNIYEEQSLMGANTFAPMCVTQSYQSWFRVQLYAQENSPTAYIEYEFAAISEL